MHGPTIIENVSNVQNNSPSLHFFLFLQGNNAASRRSRSELLHKRQPAPLNAAAWHQITPAIRIWTEMWKIPHLPCCYTLLKNDPIRRFTEEPLGSVPQTKEAFATKGSTWVLCRKMIFLCWQGFFDWPAAAQCCALAACGNQMCQFRLLTLTVNWQVQAQHNIKAFWIN